ncbi:hypothetical protein [Palleronia sp. LCG004]|uniref:hypothetical protein n=1 Tax=Palleronia sp. LCG004 TaxID=3079304 RepID=UPI002943AFD4|nr:hypothetical protein [Palleronia sp. LCG004]WOI55065.1 hypothetical protein RVY76_08300 [Palleronia sp. LCG004]
MSPLTRNLALTAAAISIPAVLAAVAGPDRVRQLPGQMRDLLSDDDTVEGQLKRLTHRLNSLTTDLHIHSSNRDTMVQVGRIAAIFGAVLIVPAALAAWIGPERIRDKARQYRNDFMASDGVDRMRRGFADDLDDLEDDIQQQRDDAYDAVTRAARDVRD